MRLAQIEADRVKAVGAEKAKTAEEASKREQDAILHERLLKQANDPAVKATFAPFLASGRFMFPKPLADRWWYDKSQPASLSFLQANGYVANVRTFAFTMAGERRRHPGEANDGSVNDRKPHHRFPTTDPEWTEMERLYEQFKELAPVWVELGLLAK